MKRNIIGIVGCILLVVVMVGLYIFRTTSKKTAPPTAPSVKIGYMAFASNWPVFLAQEGKFFEKEGIRVELVKFASGVDAANALSKGDITSMVVNPLTDLMNMEARSPGLFKIYAMQQSIVSGNYTDTMLVDKNSPMTTVQDLVGKKVGVNPGTFAEGMIKILLEQEKVQNITFVQLAPNLQLQALKSGQIDALVAYEPGTTIALTEGSAKVLLPHPFENVMNPFPNVAFTISTQVLKKDKVVVDKIITAMEKAIVYGRSHGPEANEAAAKYVGIPTSLLNQLRYPDQVLGKEIDQKKVQEVADLFFQKGLAPKEIKMTDLLYIHD